MLVMQLQSIARRRLAPLVADRARRCVACLALVAAPGALRAQDTTAAPRLDERARAVVTLPQLVPSDRAPYRQRFDVQAREAQYLFVPQVPLALTDGPYRFRFEHPALQAGLEQPSTVSYVSVRDGGVLLQVLQTRSWDVTPDQLGPQRFWLVNAAGDPVAHGVVLVVGPLPEAVDFATGDGTRVAEVGRRTAVRFEIRPHGNATGVARVLNPRDVEVTGLAPEPDSAPGETMILRGMLRVLRPEATEVRLGLETVDGRTAELAFGGLVARPATPRRVAVQGGPIVVDQVGRAIASLLVRDVPPVPGGRPELVPDAAGELTVLDQRYDAETQTLAVELEVAARTVRQPGARDLRDLLVRAGERTFRGTVELVGPPQVSAVRTEPAGRPVVMIGGGVERVHVLGQNLDVMRLDCTLLGPGASCRTVGATATELITEVTLAPPVREGEYLLPLASTASPSAGGAPASAAVRLVAEYPAIPMPLEAASFIRLACPRPDRCRAGADHESVVVAADAARQLGLAFAESEIPPVHGWQKLLVTVTRVRGEQRQVVRTFGTSASPRMVRHGMPAGTLTLLDAGADPRHGDQFIVRVEHAAEQYAADQRARPATGEAFVRRIYIDGGAGKRITGDIAVQPVLLALGRDGDAAPWYPNAGFGLTWQFLNARLEPRFYSIKLQLLATNIQPKQSEGRTAGQPAAFLSGNVRIPGTDPNRPLTLTGGVAHLFGASGGLHLLVGAGIDLGVARLIFGS